MKLPDIAMAMRSIDPEMMPLWLIDSISYKDVDGSWVKVEGLDMLVNSKRFLDRLPVGTELNYIVRTDDFMKLVAVKYQELRLRSGLPN